jgi:hypothetical protein
MNWWDCLTARFADEDVSYGLFDEVKALLGAPMPDNLGYAEVAYRSGFITGILWALIPEFSCDSEQDAYGVRYNYSHLTSFGKAYTRGIQQGEAATRYVLKEFVSSLDFTYPGEALAVFLRAVCKWLAAPGRPFAPMTLAHARDFLQLQPEEIAIYPQSRENEP